MKIMCFPCASHVFPMQLPWSHHGFRQKFRRCDSLAWCACVLGLPVRANLAAGQISENGAISVIWLYIISENNIGAIISYLT
jgi:hypothetical protein